MSTLPWWATAVVYQVYPRSFADSDGDGVGDIPGIRSRLDHLAGAPGALGVDAIWLSPVYPSPMADNGYDVECHTDVDPVFGTLADLDALIADAHSRGLRVLLDWVPNHTSDRHPWFQEALTGRDSPMRGRYVWRDPAPDGGPPNDWVSAFPGVGPAWTLDRASGQYYLHSFLPQQPDLDWDDPGVEAAMLDTLRFWLDRGVDGFRIDVAHAIGKRPGDGGDVRQDQDWPRGHEVLRRVRRLLEEYPGDRMAVGEVYVLDQARLVRYVMTGDELHLAHNFVFLRAPWDAARMREVIEEFTALAGERTWPCWTLDNHDHSRTATRYAGGGDGQARARVAGMLVLTLRGTPFLYQGQELGLPDAPIPAGRVVDMDGRDPQRAPLVWEPPSRAGPGAGFTTGEPWLPPLDGALAERLAASAQRSDPASTLSFFRELLTLRRASPALREGSQRMVDAGPDVLAFVREAPGERVLVALNLAATERPLGLDRLDGPAEVLLATHADVPAGPVRLGGMRLPGDRGIVARLGP